MKLRYQLAAVTVLIAFVTSSCSSPKELQYVQGNFDTAELSKLVLPQPTVQKGDLLNIEVFSDNETASLPFNQAGKSSQVDQSEMPTVKTAMQTSGSNYLVDLQGFINFPIIGKLKVEELNKVQLTELLDGKLKKYLSNPYYNIRFINFKITMVGELTKPGVYSIPNERVNILEAIGMAGDLTFFGKRDNVLIVREANGKREFGRIDLRNPNVFKSPYYFLQQNDIVIVDMSKRKIAANDQVAFRNVSLAATVISAIAVILTVLK